LVFFLFYYYYYLYYSYYITDATYTSMRVGGHHTYNIQQTYIHHTTHAHTLQMYIRDKWHYIHRTGKINIFHCLFVYVVLCLSFFVQYFICIVCCYAKILKLKSQHPVATPYPSLLTANDDTRLS